MSDMKKEFYLSTAVYKLDESIKTSGYKPKSKFGGECTSLVVEQELRECEAPGAIRNDRINGVMKKIEKELNSNIDNLKNKILYNKENEI